MNVIAKGFESTEVADQLIRICKEKIRNGLNDFNDFGKLYGVVYDIAYRGNGVLEISKMED